ncbi:hypothetical protein [Caulobacter sp. DWP3-1-3b2]|uniref:hypothetical protein n=1 Tax=Caulobacter sp. DWP3-1-3b2 TaxID=2804643 RepID=UPI003CEA2BD9
MDNVFQRLVVKPGRGGLIVWLLLSNANDDEGQSLRRDGRLALAEQGAKTGV